MSFQRDTTKTSRRIRSYRMPDSRKHRYVGRTVRECTGFSEIDTFVFSISTNAARFFILRKQRRKYAPGRNVIFEFEPVANHFLETKMQGNRADLKIQSSCNQNIAIAEIAS